MWATRPFTRNIKYSYVDNVDDDAEKLMSRSSDDNSESSSGKSIPETSFHFAPTSLSRLPQISGNTTGIVTLILFYGLSIFATVVGTHAMQNRGNYLLKKTSAYSPTLEKVHIPMIRKKIDATLFPNPSNPEHIYRMPPSPEVDAAWDRISHIGMHILTKEEVDGIGKNSTECTKTQPNWGYGPDTYIAEIDVFHQLHCLNSLRKTNILYYDHYWGHKWGYEPPVMFESHVDHCIDILRQNIMCNADAEMLTYNWRKTQDKPFPDIGAHKVCRDFDALLKWQEEVELKDEPAKWKRIIKPADAVDLPMPPHLDELEVTSHGEGGIMLKKLKGITRPADCPAPAT